MLVPPSPDSTVLGDSDTEVWVPVPLALLSRHYQALHDFRKSDSIMNDVVKYEGLIADLIRHEPSRTLKRYEIWNGLEKSRPSPGVHQCVAGNKNAYQAAYISRMKGYVRKLWKKAPHTSTSPTMKRLKELLNTLSSSVEAEASWPAYPGSASEPGDPPRHSESASADIMISSDSDSERTKHTAHAASIAAETEAITYEDVVRVRAISKRPASSLLQVRRGVTQLKIQEKSLSKNLKKKPSKSSSAIKEKIKVVEKPSKNLSEKSLSKNIKMVEKKERGRVFYQLICNDGVATKSVCCFCPKKLNLSKGQAKALALRVCKGLADFSGSHEQMRAHALECCAA